MRGERTQGEGAAHRLLEVARTLSGDLELEAVLGRVLEAAIALTGARYAALGVIDEGGEGLARFLTLGIDDERRAAIGELPRGRGVLGELIRHPEPIRLLDVGEHPRSFGFPSGHPPMRSFLGVPVVIRGRPYGNLYLTEKAGGEFDAADEDVVMGLAGLAAVAIDNAHAYEDLARRNAELERVTHRLQATAEIAKAVTGVTDLDAVAELLVKRSRALLGARTCVLCLRDGDGFVVAAAAGELASELRGRHIETITDVGYRMPAAGSPLCEALSPEVRALLPGDRLLAGLLQHRGEPIGSLLVFGAAEGADDALAAVAATAATAVATAQLAHERERALETAAQLAAIVDGTDDAIYSRDRHGRLVSWNRGAERLFGWHADEVIGRTAQFLAPPGQDEAIGALFERVLAGDHVEHLEAERARKDGSIVPVSITVSAIRDAQGEIAGASTIARDMSAWRRHEEELRNLADTDPLTGLHNRRRFFRDLERLMTYLHRYRRRGAVLLIDLDGFKQINDRLGHDAGDAVLIEVARVLRDHGRRSDLIARLGGDEFVVALPEVDDAAAEVAADRLSSALRTEVAYAPGQRVSTSATVGLATFDGSDDVSAEELVRRADAAMYAKKPAAHGPPPPEHA